MKLSRLIHYKNLLDDLSSFRSDVEVSKQVGQTLHTVANHDVQFTDLALELDQNYKNIVGSYRDFFGTVDKIKSELSAMIDSMEKKYFLESYRLYEEEMIHDTNDLILNRRFSLTKESLDYIHARIQLRSDWHHAGMIIRPGLESWVDLLVACDPLYLIDQDQELLEASMSRFNPQYRARLRPYIVKERTDDIILSKIPDGQFGFCLVYNFFNYKPLDVIKRYLSEIYNKLKPGGILALTFNDCDRAAGVELAERSFMCYTPGNLLIELMKSYGFEILVRYQMDASNCWIECTKPGTLTSYRGGQTLARIFVHEPILPIDNEQEKKYTEEELESLYQTAIDLNIDSPEMIRTAYSNRALEKLIKRKRKHERSLTGPS